MASTVNNLDYAVCKFCKGFITKEKGMWSSWIHENGLMYCTTPVATPFVRAVSIKSDEGDSAD